MYERFTDRARKVMQLANQEAQRFNHEYIGTEHVLLGLVKEGSGVAANVLKNLDVDLRKIRLEVEKIVQSGPDMVTMGKLPQTPRAKKVIEYALEEAKNLNHNYVGTEHLLLGLLREQEGVAAQVLMNLGLKLEDVREEVLNLLGHGLEGAEATERTSGSSMSFRSVIFLARWRWSTDYRARRRPSPVKILFAPPSPRSNLNQRWPALISLPRDSFVCFPSGSARRPSATNDARRLASSRRKVAAFLQIWVIYCEDSCGFATVVTWRAR